MKMGEDTISVIKAIILRRMKYFINKHESYTLENCV